MIKITQKSYGRDVEEGLSEMQGSLGTCCCCEDDIARQREQGQPGRDEEANVQV